LFKKDAPGVAPFNKTLAVIKMKFFFSGELDVDIADSYREIRKLVESTLNEQLGENNYGEEIQKISIIPIILGPRFIEGKKERRLIKKKEKVADYRLFVDFNTWLNGTNEIRTNLIIDNILEAVDDINRKLKDSFNGDSLRNDILRSFNKESSTR